jgi:hypothetical protein
LLYDIRVLLDDVGDALRIADDFIERGALGRIEVDIQPVVVRVRDKALGHDAEHLHGRKKHPQE